MEKFKRFQEAVDKVYDKAKEICQARFSYSKVIYGRSFEDLYQDAVMMLIEYYKENKPSVDNMDAYCQESIVNNFCQAVQKQDRKLKVRNNPKNRGKIKREMVTNCDKDRAPDIEKVEVRNLLKNLNGKTKSFVLMSLRGDETTEDKFNSSRSTSATKVRDIKRKLYIKSLRQYYKAENGVKRLIKKKGYNEEI